MITISDILKYLYLKNEENIYYWDALNDNGYHLHVFPHGKILCMKLMRKTIKVISEEEFINDVNYKCYLNNISEDSYYFSLLLNSYLQM